MAVVEVCALRVQQRPAVAVVKARARSGDVLGLGVLADHHDLSVLVIKEVAQPAGITQQAHHSSVHTGIPASWYSVCTSMLLEPSIQKHQVQNFKYAVAMFSPGLV